MAPGSLFSKSLRFSLLFCRNGHPVEGLASHFGRRLISSSEIPAGQDDSTVSYLVDSCGLSPESAILVSHKVMPNIGLLRELGMPQSSIAMLIAYHAQIVMRRPDSFSQVVGEVKQLGFDLRKSFFVQAMLALSSEKKTAWKRNEEAYRRWGWSDNEILSAFRLCPLCMTKSEKKIMGTMDFLVNKMG